MDKRTLIFAVSVFLSIVLVNTYFDWQHEGKVQQRNIEQQAKRKNTLTQLERYVAENITTIEELPLVELYETSESETPISDGILSDNAILTTSWNDTPPKSIYIKPADSSEKKLYVLTHAPDHIGDLLIYQINSKENLSIGNLPDLGLYDLQLVAFSRSPVASKVYLAKFQDGLFSIVDEEIDIIKNELDDKHVRNFRFDKTGIVLINQGNKYVPVGIYYGDKKNFVQLEDFTALAARTTTQQKSQEYYVLENEYQQLVFTNIGGALIEINLPFASKTNSASVVRSIEFDKDMQKNHPYNDHFPAHPYYTAGQTATGPHTYHEEGSLGGYYPLLRRDLQETGQWKSVQINPRYYALNLLSEQPEISELNYTVKHFDSTKLILEAQHRQRKITKTFILPENGAPYCFEASIKIDGEKRGLWISSGVPEVELFSGNPEPILKYRITRANKPTVETISLPKDTITNGSTYADWLCNSNGFFGIIIDPLKETSEGFMASFVPGQNVPSRLVEVDQAYDRFQADSLPGYMMLLPVKANQKNMNLRIFAGPFSGKILKAVDKIYTDPTTGENPDYIASQSYHGFFSFISEPFAKFLFVLMNFFHSLTGSWAFSIILLTVALRIMMYPLNAWSTKSMLSMQQIAPEISAIQERNKNDPKKAQLEIMDLYRQKGINPLSGCFPLLIQLPFLIGMFDLLKTTFELRGASFIPGWIDNLTAPDVLFSWGTPIFFIGNQFHLLPILLGFVMFLQQRLFTSGPTNVNEMTDQQRQQRAMATFMPIVFTFMFYHFPSGLNIYWLSSTLLGIAQQWWTQKRMAKTSNVIVIPAPKKKK